MRPLPYYLLWLTGLRKAETQTTERERATLAVRAAGRAAVVEIGVWHGVTTAVLRRAMAPDGTIWAVDPFPAGRLGFSLQAPIAHAEVRRIRNGRIRWVRMNGHDAANLYLQDAGRPVDLIFIDGDHSYEGLLRDWHAWSPLVARGGVVCLHDSRSTPERRIDDAGSVRATSEVIRRDSAFEVVEEIDSLTVVRKRQT